MFILKDLWLENAKDRGNERGCDSDMQIQSKFQNAAKATEEKREYSKKVKSETAKRCALRAAEHSGVTNMQMNFNQTAQ